MKEQLVGWRNKILSTDEEQSALRRGSRAGAGDAAQRSRAYSAAVLYYEMRGFEPLPIGAKWAAYGLMSWDSP